ncbi:MAG: ABC transporter permease subunit, partial [Caldilinea sp.]
MLSFGKLFRRFFADIPQEILDAARVDGASWPRILFQLIIPISLPAMISGALVLFLGTWNSFF